LLFVGLSGKSLLVKIAFHRSPLNAFIHSFSLAIKNTEDNGPTKKDPASSDLLCDGEQ
jgi:hypothetical protein